MQRLEGLTSHCTLGMGPYHRHRAGHRKLLEERRRGRTRRDTSTQWTSCGGKYIAKAVDEKLKKGRNDCPLTASVNQPASPPSFHRLECDTVGKPKLTREFFECSLTLTMSSELQGYEDVLRAKHGIKNNRESRFSIIMAMLLFLLHKITGNFFAYDADVLEHGAQKAQHAKLRHGIQE